MERVAITGIVQSTQKPLANGIRILAHVDVVARGIAIRGIALAHSPKFGPIIMLPRTDQDPNRSAGEAPRGPVAIVEPPLRKAIIAAAVEAYQMLGGKLPERQRAEVDPADRRGALGEALAEAMAGD